MSDNKIAENETTEIFSIVGYGDKHKIQVHERSVPDMRARFAMALLEKWGMVMGTQDGEDKAGRSKGRRMTAKEVADYAVDLSAAAFERFTDQKWMVQLPPWGEVRDRAKEEN